MKHLRQLCATVVLSFVLVSYSFAGEMATGDVPPPPPPQTTLMTSDTSTEVTATNDRSSTETTFVAPVTEFSLDILQSVLSLF